MYDLINKSMEINASKYGAFSKNGYENSIVDKGYDLVKIENLYNF
jgi:hypothetical protein